MDSAPILAAVEAAIFEPVMKPVEDALGPAGPIIFSRMLEQVFDAGAR